MVTAIPLTSKLSALRFPHSIQVDPSPENGLTTPSVAMVFQIAAIDKRRLRRKAGDLEPSYLDQINHELHSLLDLT